ncbi:hypothetical protein F0562_030904 [Nyssa sinensis]|uniref:DAGKc domain-containing protein n=1 Tax=Nyssa sinensis TaxID=561372 RepID=A0A5J5B457_9ASTE|nr:hypothetical protein F0562_030904 [Nyssa sinensis]
MIAVDSWSNHISYADIAGSTAKGLGSSCKYPSGLIDYAVFYCGFWWIICSSAHATLQLCSILCEKCSKLKTSRHGDINVTVDDPVIEKREEHRIDIGDEQSDLLGYEVFSGKVILDKRKSSKSTDVQTSTEITNQDTVDAKLTSKALVWGSHMLCLEDVISVSYSVGLRHFTVHSYPVTKEEALHWSGRGRSSKVFHGMVEPIFKLAGFKMEVVKTTSAGHAKNLASSVDFSSCPDGIICVGGDGIVNEVLNGLLSRDNQKEAISIPIGIIPAGSDNSLVWTVLGVRDPVSAAIAIVKGGLTATDVFAVEWIETGVIHFGMTVSYFGFVSDGNSKHCD